MSRQRRKGWERVQKDRLARIHRMFEKHFATLTAVGEGDDRIELLTWGEPDTRIHRVYYTSRGPWLFVTGDLYDAVYERAGGLEWWARCDLHYFESKCRASPEGRHFKEWEPELARANAVSALSGVSDKERRAEFFRSGGAEATHSEEAWIDWLRASGDDVFHDAWEYGEIGRTISWVCEAHLIGLKMAMAQIAAREPQPEARAA